MSADGPGAAGTIAVEVAWSPRARVVETVALTLPAGATVARALVASGVATLAVAGQGEDAFEAAQLSAAVWGRRRPLDAPLRDGDRVEVLRALVVAPMDARRERFEAAGGIRTLRQRGLAAQKR